MSNLSLAALIKSVGTREPIPPAPVRRVKLRWRPDQGGYLRSTSAVLDGHEAWGLFVTAREDLPLKALVGVEDEGGAYQTQVIGRRRLRDDWEIELAFIGSGRRCEDRTPVSGTAEVEISGDDPDRAPVRQAVEVADVSSGGMRLRTDRPIQVASRVRISGKRDLYFGVTRYCYKNGKSYDVGVQFIHCNPGRERRAADL